MTWIWDWMIVAWLQTYEGPGLDGKELHCQQRGQAAEDHQKILAQDIELDDQFANGSVQSRSRASSGARSLRR